MKRYLILVCSMVLVTACGTKKTAENKQAAIPLQDLYKQSTQVLFKARPATATMLGVDKETAGGDYNNRLADFSPSSEAQMRENLRQITTQLKNRKSTKVDENKQVMENLGNYFSGNRQFDIGYIDTWMGLSPFIVNQINGPLIDVPNTLITNQQIKSSADAMHYIKRLDHYDLFVENILKKLLADSDNNWLPPLVIVNKSIASMKGFIKPKPSNHPFVTSFEKKISNNKNINTNEKKQLIEKLKHIVTSKVYPSYRNVIHALEDLSMSARVESGVWAQPNGDEFYQEAVKMLGDTNLTPAQIHQLGLSEVNRIIKEMDLILKSQDMHNGTVGQRMTKLNDDSQFLYEDSDVGRKQLLDDLNDYINEISARMGEQFATRPQYDVEVRKFPKSREDSAPGGMYTNPPIDGSQPGIYWINLRDIKANPKFDLKTLTYHEAIPGHHWQIALNLEQESLPLLRRIAPYNAYIEGWALYSEKVAAEMGMYKNDPFGDLGRLKAELFRAVRLVVDTGLHYKKWTREQAIKYMAETTGTVESDVVAEIERYMVWPGQALGYKLGMINILGLRDKAQKKLGKKFDIKAFHDLILLGGAVPMEVLNDKVEAWIKSNK